MSQGIPAPQITFGRVLNPLRKSGKMLYSCISLFSLLRVAAGARAGWHFVQNGTSGTLVREAMIVSPTLACSTKPVPFLSWLTDIRRGVFFEYRGEHCVAVGRCVRFVLCLKSFFE
ncbi:hypothetical protein JB92DRAFT_1762587 [Gautieria morchelliformis]|nr:hypothetical protein JB92DRAFT_1762587 [Gautieria morchelliformis]